MNFDLEIKIFIGKIKLFVSVYMSFLVDENFGEGIIIVDKDGYFYVEWVIILK